MLKPSWSILTLITAFVVWYWLTGKPKNNESFRKKNVIITGASTGIGEQIAYRFCEQGANVLITARRELALKTVVRKCYELGGGSSAYIVADLQNGNGSRALYDESLRHFKTVDVLVLNHVFYEIETWQHDRKFDEIHKVFNINVLSYIQLTTLFLPSLQASSGRVVVISSGLGVLTYPYFALYCSNKHALHGFFNALRQDFAMDPERINMTITISVLGAIATENAMKVSPNNPVAGSNGWYRLSSVDASVAILEGSLNRERQIYFPSFLKLHEFLSVNFPVFTEWFIRYAFRLKS